MTHRPQVPWRGAAAAVSVVALFAIAACGSDDTNQKNGSTGSRDSIVASVSKQSDIAAQVPQDIRKRGSITAVLDRTAGLPMSELGSDGKSVTGVSPELAQALGKVLGVKVKFAFVDFDAMIPGFAAGRYDVSTNNFTVTPERQQQLDFINVLSTTMSLLVRKADGHDGLDLNSLCGLTIAVNVGSTQESLAKQAAAQCHQDGKPDLTVSSLTGNGNLLLAVKSRRADTMLVNSVTADYMAGADSAIKISNDKVTDPAISAFALPKDSGLTAPLRAALKYLEKTGVYTKILTKFHIQNDAVTSTDMDGPR